LKDKLKKKKLGLALGGGAVLGAAHIGVLRAIEEFDIPISYLSGTSIGAFVGSFSAFGNSWKEIKEIASGLQWLDITEISLSRFGLISNERLGELIRKHIGEKQIEDADIPLALVATDITTGEKVVLKKGSLADAVMASTAIPGIFQPVEIDGRLLVDGGVLENVPIHTVKTLGARRVIGVDLNASHTYDKPDNILDVILNSFHYMMQAADRIQTEEADVLITPDLSSFNRSDMGQMDELMEKGYQAANKTFKKNFND